MQIQVLECRACRDGPVAFCWACGQTFCRTHALRHNIDVCAAMHPESIQIPVCHRCGRKCFTRGIADFYKQCQMCDILTPWEKSGILAIAGSATVTNTMFFLLLPVLIYCWVLMFMSGGDVPFLKFMAGMFFLFLFTGAMFFKLMFILTSLPRKILVMTSQSAGALVILSLLTNGFTGLSPWEHFYMTIAGMLMYMFAQMALAS